MSPTLRTLPDGLVRPQNPERFPGSTLASLLQRGNALDGEATMAKLYGPHYAEIWRAALCLPGHTDLADSLAQEYADYRSISLSAARERLEESWRSHSQRRRKAFPTDLEPEKLRRYYDANEELGMEIGLSWHSLRTDPWPLHSVAGLHAVQQMADATSVFEFGHGIGRESSSPATASR
jgi:hypothetical protein